MPIAFALVELPSWAYLTETQGMSGRFTRLSAAMPVSLRNPLPNPPRKGEGTERLFYVRFLRGGREQNGVKIGFLRRKSPFFLGSTPSPSTGNPHFALGSTPSPSTGRVGEGCCI